ncbi:hypothetical protein ACFE04_028125 [Oxalis oulophora]
MAMDRSLSSSTTSVLSIECLKGSSKAGEWTDDMLQTGDIVEELKLGVGSRSSSASSYTSPFKNGKSGIQKILHTSFRNKETSILVRVRRGVDEFTELQACIVPNDSAGRKQYMLRSIDDPNYIVAFTDRTESECFDLQASRSSRMISALNRTRLQDKYVAYPWEKKMAEMLATPNSSCFLSLLLLPKASNEAASRYNDLEDTLARANAWLNASQHSGVPIAFINIQTESLLTKISGETASATVNASSLSDLSNLANVSMYGFEDYHGVDLGVVRAVRLWYAPVGGEYSIEIKLKETDTRLGFAISRTDEFRSFSSQSTLLGFVYISTVVDGDDDAPSTRSGLSSLYKEAKASGKKLVVSRVSNQKALPWMVSSTGAVRCFETTSLSHKLSLHRHAKVPIILHLFLWDEEICSSNRSSDMFTSTSTAAIPLSPPPPPPLEFQSYRHPNENQVLPFIPGETSESIALGNEPGIRLERDTAGNSSFRFHDFAIPNNWV